MKKILIAVLGLSAVSLGGVNGQIVITSSTNFTYSQDFNTLPTSGNNNTWTNNSTLLSWYSSRSVIIASGGTSTTSGLYSFGNGTNTDRSLGYLSGGSAGNGGNFSVVFLNNSGSSIALNNIKLTYTGEQWRSNTNNSTLTFGYRISGTQINDSTSGTYISNTAFNFTSLQTAVSGTAINGNISSNQQAFSNISLDSTGSLASGEYLALRWDRGTQASGAGLGIDDFSLNVVPEPTTWALIGVGTAFVLWRIRRKRSAA